MKNIKALRQEYGYSQKKLADLTGISQQSIANYENGKTTPPPEVLERIANVFAVSVDEIGNDGSDSERIFYVPRPDEESKRIGIGTAYFKAWLEVNEITCEPKEKDGINGIEITHNTFPDSETFFIRNSQFTAVRNGAVNYVLNTLKRCDSSSRIDKDSLLNEYREMEEELKNEIAYQDFIVPILSHLNDPGKTEAEMLSDLSELKTFLESYKAYKKMTQ